MGPILDWAGTRLRCSYSKPVKSPSVPVASVHNDAQPLPRVSKWLAHKLVFRGCKKYPVDKFGLTFTPERHQRVFNELIRTIIGHTI